MHHRRPEINRPPMITVNSIIIGCDRDINSSLVELIRTCIPDENFIDGLTMGGISMLTATIEQGGYQIKNAIQSVSQLNRCAQKGTPITSLWYRKAQALILCGNVKNLTLFPKEKEIVNKPIILVHQEKDLSAEAVQHGHLSVYPIALAEIKDNPYQFLDHLMNKIHHHLEPETALKKVWAPETSTFNPNRVSASVDADSAPATQTEPEKEIGTPETSTFSNRVSVNVDADSAPATQTEPRNATTLRDLLAEVETTQQLKVSLGSKDSLNSSGSDQEAPSKSSGCTIS